MNEQNAEEEYEDEGCESIDDEEEMLDFEEDEDDSIVEVEEGSVKAKIH